MFLDVLWSTCGAGELDLIAEIQKMYQFKYENE